MKDEKKIAEALKPCPFCGGQAERINIDDEHVPNYGGTYIGCPRCLASSRVAFGEKIGLEEAWNRRAALSSGQGAEERESLWLATRVKELRTKAEEIQRDENAEWKEGYLDALQDIMRWPEPAVPAPEQGEATRCCDTCSDGPAGNNVDECPDCKDGRLSQWHPLPVQSAPSEEDGGLLRDAIGTIDKLRAENKSLRAALADREKE